MDTSHTIDEDSESAIVTAKDDDGVEVLRHSCAHLMAQAVQQLFPTAQVTIGPTVEDGFYYYFAYERPFTPEDLEQIEKCMTEISRENLTVERSLMSRSEAIELFQEKGEAYKVQIIEDIPDDQDLSFYQQGDFIDLCRGPHIPSTGKLQAFKLTKVAGAYWRGDSRNEMLQRIYGTAWADKKSLKQYLNRLAEAEKRDHRKLGKKFDLFHTQEEAPGMVFWHPKGWTVWQVIKQYIRSVQQANGYLEINTPQVVDMSLWEKSGHADKFGDDMFSVQADNRLYAIKPMNCPCHVQVFNQGLKSYRELPMRLAEFGSCHRDEPSGTLQGTMLATQSYLQISQNRALMVPILKRGLTCLHRTSCTSTMPTGANFSPQPRRGMTLRYMPSTSLFDRQVELELYERLQSADPFARSIFLVRGVDRHGGNDFTVRAGNLA